MSPSSGFFWVWWPLLYWNEGTWCDCGFEGLWSHLWLEQMAFACRCFRCSLAFVHTSFIQYEHLSCDDVPCSFLIFQEALKMIRTAVSAFLVLVVMSTDGKYIPKEGRREPQLLSRGLSHDLRLMAEFGLFWQRYSGLCGGPGWGDQLIWAQTYEEALYWSRSKYVIKTCNSCVDGKLMEQINQRKPAFQKQASDGHLPSGELQTQPGWAPPSKCLRNPWTTFYNPFFSSLAALKKVFSEERDIQQTIDEDLVVLNLVVSQKRAVTQQKLGTEPLIPELSTKVLHADLWLRPEKNRINVCTSSRTEAE